MLYESIPATNKIINMRTSDLLRVYAIGTIVEH
jgi:hypothetical protein